MDTSRLSTCSIALNDRSADRTFAAIADAGYTKVEVHEKVHLSLFPEDCDPIALKRNCRKARPSDFGPRLRRRRPPRPGNRIWIPKLACGQARTFYELRLFQC